MYGAILGDIIGSPYEFDRGDKTKTFPLFSKKSTCTDDSVMTLAVGKALMDVGTDANVEEIKKAVVAEMQSWGKKIPNAGYGGKFYFWIRERHPKPYGSWGNGSAMRVSAAGWLYDSLERTREVARATAEVTHNHREGIKGAEAVAAVIYLARHNTSKEKIKQYVTEQFHYNLNRTLDEIRPTYSMDVSCQRTVPEAIIAFLEGNDFEDVVRNAVSLGGDTDTLGAIAGSMAEAFYGINGDLIAECRNRVDQSKMIPVLEQFTGTLNWNMRDLLKEFSSLLYQRGHSPEIIRNTYLELLTTEKEIREALHFLKENPDASQEDDNYEIFRIDAKRNGINI